MGIIGDMQDSGEARLDLPSFVDPQRPKPCVKQNAPKSRELQTQRRMSRSFGMENDADIFTHQTMISLAVKARVAEALGSFSEEEQPPSPTPSAGRREGVCLNTPVGRMD